MRFRSWLAFPALVSIVAACGSPSSNGNQPSGISSSGSGSGSGMNAGSGSGSSSGAGSSSGSPAGSSSSSSGGVSGGDGGSSVADASPSGPDGSRPADGGGVESGSGGGVDAASLPSTTIWIAGDSTVQTYAAGNTVGFNGASLEGWGQELGPYFINKVTINNQAIGGRSVAFFMYAVAKDSAGNYLCVDTLGDPQYQLDASGNRIDTSQWAAIKSGIKAGDFLLVQFGHNDETHTCPRYVGPADYETDLGIMADTVRAKGATPIFVTPMGHRAFTGTTVNNTLLPYANAMKDEAMKKAVEVEDLNLRSVAYYQTVGDAFLATNIFDGGTTHFIKPGAIKIAELIAGEVRRNNGPLAAYLK